MVDIIKDIFICKSEDRFYAHECNGEKCNTVRVLRPLLEDGYNLDQVLSCRYIIIEHAGNRNLTFFREISNIAGPIEIQNSCEKIIVISWKHPTVN